MADDEQDMTQQEEQSPSAETSRSGSTVWIILSVGIVVAAAGAGFGVARLLNAPRQADAATHEPSIEEDLAQAISDVDCEYYEFDPITVNLNEPRLARHLVANIVLTMRKENADAAKELVDKKKPELVSWLNAYLSGLTLDEVRGSSSQNRLAREIKDAFNDRLWPDRSPLILQVLFKQFGVQ